MRREFPSYRRVSGFGVGPLVGLSARGAALTALVSAVLEALSGEGGRDG